MYSFDSCSTSADGPPLQLALAGPLAAWRSLLEATWSSCAQLSALFFLLPVSSLVLKVAVFVRILKIVLPRHRRPPSVAPRETNAPRFTLKIIQNSVGRQSTGGTAQYIASACIPLTKHVVIRGPTMCLASRGLRQLLRRKLVLPQFMATGVEEVVAANPGFTL